MVDFGNYVVSGAAKDSIEVYNGPGLFEGASACQGAWFTMKVLKPGITNARMKLTGNITDYVMLLNVSSVYKKRHDGMVKDIVICRTDNPFLDNESLLVTTPGGCVCH